MSAREPVVKSLAEKMVRYESLFEFIEELLASESPSACVDVAAHRLKYLASISAWRLIVALNPGFLVADSWRGNAEVQERAELGAWDALQWQTFLSGRQRGDAFAGDAGAPAHLRAAGFGEINTMAFERAGHPIGLLVTATRQPGATPLDQKFLRMAGATLAEQLGGLVLRRRALEALERQVGRDALTGAMNRRAITEALKRQLVAARHTDQTLCVLMADVDHFKSINDRFGHPAGDEVLRELARRIAATLREGDHFGRFGGEEFLFVLHPCTAERAHLVGERVRAAVADTPFLITSGDTPFELPVTISLGGTCTARLKAGGDEALVKQADTALYASKHGGRNQVTMARADDDDSPQLQEQTP